MGLYEFIVLGIDEKASIVWADGIMLSVYVENGHAFTLYKLPNFYAEIEFSREHNRIVDVVGFLNGWKLEKHVDQIKIDTL